MPGHAGQTHSALVISLERAVNAFIAGPNVRHEPNLRWKEVEAMFDILEKIIEKERSRDAADDLADLEWNDMNNCEEKANRFMRWLQFGNDVQWAVDVNLNSDKSKFELWLTSNRNLIGDDTLFSVPPKAFMSGEAAAKKLKFLGISATDCNQSLMILFLIYEKYVMGDKSYWKPFIDVLPSIRYFNLPFCFSREDLALAKNCRALYCEVLDLLLNRWLTYCSILIPLMNEKNLIGKTLGKVLTYRRMMWSDAVINLSYKRAVTLGKDGEISEIMVRVIPVLDMCDIKEVETPPVLYQSDTDENYVCKMIGFPETPFQLTRSYGECSMNYFLSFGYVPKNPAIDKEIYKLNLTLTSHKSLNPRRRAALVVSRLTTMETFELKPHYFLNRKSKSVEAQAILNKLFVFVNICLADDESLRRIERTMYEDDMDFLAEPSKEVWTFLTERFDLLKKLSDMSLKNLLGKVWENNDFDPSQMKRRERVILQYMINENHCLTRFAEITASRRDNDPEDEPSPESEIPDEKVIQFSDTARALLGDTGLGMVSRCALKKIYGPVSVRPNPDGAKDLLDYLPTGNGTN